MHPQRCKNPSKKEENERVFLTRKGCEKIGLG
jgi:hypothetical protein